MRGSDRVRVVIADDDPQTVLEIRSSFKRAADVLAALHNCSHQEAQERIRQEAMAKQTGLDEIVRAILTEEQVHYGRTAEVAR